ncbi:unnamed protein product [Rotaria magnacalcarata]|uniref:Coiled-coil domain-containing protein 25 n=1 Tax=Rotaria magnacalcarata TaxID=392030 RepID=A0A819NJK7_9BILA|nr:unnamed protein product [Rotaria magnacalcarata]
MVFFFTSNVVNPPYTIYMGRDKYENNELLKYCWPEDIWFHVSKLSSAHVYLRLRKGETIDNINADALEDCCQLVKANSIEGCKLNKVDIVYTPVDNLRQTNDMDVGQVGFHVDKNVRQYIVSKKQNDIVNRLNKTKTEISTELFITQREQRDNLEREDKKRLMREQKQRDKEEDKRRQEQAELRNYTSLMHSDKMRSNKTSKLIFDENFLSMTANHRPLSIIARCALCSIKAELFVCSHCDKVICQICLDKHQLQLNEILKEQWGLCKTKYLNLYHLSDNHAKEMVNVENEMDRIRLLVNQRYTDLVNLIENEKNNVLNNIEENIQLNSSNVKHTDLQHLFDSIGQRLNNIFEDPNASYDTEDFLLEINHFNTLMKTREKQIQTSSFKYPSLSPMKPTSISDIFGELQWNIARMSNPILTRSSIIDSRSLNSKLNGSMSSETNDEFHEDGTITSEKPTSMSVMQRQKQWTLDAAGVPHFLCILSKKNHLLFACDKYGSIDLYQLDSNEPRITPRHLRQFELFPGNTTSPQPLIIETFTVYTPFIVVSAHLNDQADTSSIYFFDHRGLKQADTCLQNFPVRQLSADVSCKCLWGIDRHQHLVYYNQLPMNVQQIPNCIEHREDFIKFTRNFEPIRIAQNQTSIAIIERNSQRAQLFDKRTKKKIDEVENLLRSKGIFRLWNVLLRDDNSMVLKLDEELPPNSRPPSINHLILELDSQGLPVSQIERISVYGLVLGPNQEILLGCKKHQQNGLIECYI